MKDQFTICRGNDGFGSQLYSIISGIAFCKTTNSEYLHSELQGIKLLNKPECQNLELEKANNLINKIIKNLNLEFRTSMHTPLVKPFFHKEISTYGVDNFYDESFLKFISSSYPLEKPLFYENEYTNIAIHIRRGDDIFNPGDIKVRIIENSIYENLINILNKKIKNAKFHIFSWSDPKLNLDCPNIINHISNSGDVFLEDFNSLVHSDILVVGSSTFSISAGFFNKNTVLCNSELCKLVETPYPSIWNKNYERYINEFTY